jgi:hypothetical protein
MDKFLTLCRLAIDLHLQSSGGGESFADKLSKWIVTPQGQQVIVDLNQLLSEFGMPIVIGMRK